MIIPGTYIAALLLTVLTMLCWGSWANTFKLAGKWRFELFYFDYSLGVLVAALVAAFTFGSFGDELSFRDNMDMAGKTQMAYAFAGGVVFNLANMLLVAAISLAGMAVAFPVAIGLALVIGVCWNYFLNPQGNPWLLAGGVALVVVAIVIDALAYAAHAAAQRKGKTRKGGARGLLLCLVSGLLMGSFYPLVAISMRGEIVGLIPYSASVVFAIGVFLSTFLFNLYFMNLPVEGPTLKIGAYFRGTRRQHLLGLAGGMIWSIGAVSNFVASSAPKAVHVGPAISYAIGQGATLVSALWGLLVWKEFAGASPKVRLRLALMLIFFVLGLALLSLAPLFT